MLRAAVFIFCQGVAKWNNEICLNFWLLGCFSRFVETVSCGRVNTVCEMFGTCWFLEVTVNSVCFSLEVLRATDTKSS